MISRKHGESTIYKSLLWYIQHETSLIYPRCYIGVIRLAKVWMEIIDDVMNILYIQKPQIKFDDIHELLIVYYCTEYPICRSC